MYWSDTDIPKAHTHRAFSFARWFDTLSKMQGHSFCKRALNVIDVVDLSMPRCVLVTYFDVRCAQRLMLSSPGRCEPFPPVGKGDQGSRGVTTGDDSFGWICCCANLMDLHRFCWLALWVRDKALDLRYHQRFLDLFASFKGPCETQLVQAAHDVRTVRWFLRSAT